MLQDHIERNSYPLIVFLGEIKICGSCIVLSIAMLQDLVKKECSVTQSIDNDETNWLILLNIDAFPQQTSIHKYDCSKSILSLHYKLLRNCLEQSAEDHVISLTLH